MIKIFRSLLLGGLFFFCNHMLVQADSFQQAKQVRGSTQSILKSPQFRHLKGLIKAKVPRGGSKRNGGSSGTGGNGNGNETGNKTEGTGGSGSSNAGSGHQKSGGSSSGRRSASPESQSSPIQKSNTTSQSPQMTSGVAEGLGVLAQVFFWVVIAAVAGAMIYLIVRTFLDRDKTIKTKKTKQPSTQTIQVEEPEKPPGEIPADVYIAHAKELAAQGLYNEAVAQLLLGAMSKVERAGLIQYRRGLTNRDYLRVLRSKEGPYEAFKQIVRIYEPIGFGRRDANSSLFESSLDDYLQGFHAVSENT